jgi:cytidylate kinase
MAQHDSSARPTQRLSPGVDVSGGVVEVLGPSRGAKSLDEVRVFRLDQPIVITIDGPAGTGKSTVAHRLARRLGLDILDTGSMYRTAAAIAIDSKIELDQHKRLLEVVRASHMTFNWKAQPPEIIAFGKSYARRIREPDVTAVVSQYAGVRELRDLLVGMQREIAKDHPRIVSECRDQGSIVFPNAQVKIYLDASADVRARRRSEQLKREQNVDTDVNKLRAEIEARDANDKSRPFGALVCPKDAAVVDTSDLDLDQVIDRLYEIVREKARV